MQSAAIAFCAFPQLLQTFPLPEYCGAVFAEVASQNVVGYNTKATEEGWNYTGPVFIQVSGVKSINLQDIQMNASCPNQMANINVRDAGESRLEDYYWFKNIEGEAGPDGLEQPVPAGKNGLWFQMVYQFIEYTPEEMEENAEYGVFDDGYEDFDHWEFVTDKTFDYGSGFILQSMSESYTIQSSGQVTDEDLLYPSMVEGWNYFLNPYPAAVNLQDFQMNAACPSQMANINVRDIGESRLEDYYWFKNNGGEAGPDGMKQTVPAGKDGLWFQMVYQFIEYTPEEMEENAEYWIFDDGYEDFDHWEFVTDKTFAAGEGFLLQSMSENYSLTVLAPYDL